MIEDYYINTLTPQTLISGGWTDGTTFKGRVQKLSNNEQKLRKELNKESATHRILCGSAQTISVENRIIETTNIYKVVEIDNEQNSTETHHKEIEADYLGKTQNYNDEMVEAYYDNSGNNYIDGT